MQKLATLGAIIGTISVLALGFLWIGTTHRDRCLKAGETGCTILPWSGHSPYLSGSGGWGSTNSIWGR